MAPSDANKKQDRRKDILVNPPVDGLGLQSPLTSGVSIPHFNFRCLIQVSNFQPHVQALSGVLTERESRS